MYRLTRKLYLLFRKLLVSKILRVPLKLLFNYCNTFHLSCLAVNSGFDAQDTIVKLLEEGNTLGEPVGLDISTGEALKPADAGIYDNYNVKKQIINSW